MASTPPPAQPVLPHSAPQRGKVKIFTSSQSELPAYPLAMDPNPSALTPQCDRPARSSSLQSSFTFESPKGLAPASAGPATRKRSREFASSFDGAADDETQEKGGHSLRRRTRIDYAQEAGDDDVSAQEPKSGASKRPMPVPAVQSRKRRTAEDLSDDDSDDMHGGPKRRRLEKDATATTRAPAPRRKSTARRQPPADPPHLIQQLSSDHDVQDTIMVGVSMDGLDDSSQSSSESSFADHSSSSQRGSSPPPSPGVAGHESSQPANEVLKTTEDPDIPEESKNSSARLSPPAEPTTRDSLTAIGSGTRPPVLPAVEASETDQPVKTELAEAAQEEIHAKPRTKLPGTEDHATSVPKDGLQSPSSLPITSSPPGHAVPASDERIASIESSDPIKEEVQRTSPPSSTAQLPVETSQPQKVGPHVLPQLKPIYAAAEQQSSDGQFVPYENEEVIYPASWTEVVYPGDKSGPTVTPMATPAPTPPPPKAPQFSTAWDPTQPLTHKLFFSIYREDASHRKARGDAPLTMKEFRVFCARRHREACERQKEALANPTPEEVVPEVSKSKKGAKAKRTKGKAKPKEVEIPVVETPRASPAPESQQPTAAPTPEPIDEDSNAAELALAAEEDAPDAEPEVEPEGNGAEADRDGPLEPEIVTRHPKRQYLFKKLPDITTFEEALENPQDQGDASLYTTLASGASCLKSWQDEFNELRKICDDEDNAKRRLQNDKAIENWDARQKLDEPPIWRRTFTDQLMKVPPFFEVKGARAPKPYIDDPAEEHQRQEDMIMAQAYGFNYDSDRRHIGKQNPEAQRWEMSENRLRERKQTKKAADAAEEGVIVEGKRTRKPRVLGDQSLQPSRATTPVPVTRPRRKRGVQMEEQPPEEEQDEGFGELDAVQAAEPAPSPQPAITTRKRGPRGKAKADAAVASRAPEAPPVPPFAREDRAPNGVQEPASEEKVEGKPKTTRKRVRTTARHPLATTSYPEAKDGAAGQDGAPELQPPKAKRQRKTNAKPAPSTAAVETGIPSTSFYGQPSRQSTTNEHDESRPSTSSSSGTAHTAATVESSYSLRDKKPRNFAEENDPVMGSRKRAKPTAPDAEERQEQAKNRHRRPAPVFEIIPVHRQAPFVGESEEEESPRPPRPPPPIFKIIPVHRQAPFRGEPGYDPTSDHSYQSHMMHTFSASPDPPPTKALKPPRIRIVAKPRGGASSSANGNANGNSTGSRTPMVTSHHGSPMPENGVTTSVEASENGSLEPEKPYAEMSKSEKMSYSMKRRWAKGQMAGAVEKRKNTLAKKAEAKAAAPPPDLTPKPLKPGKPKAAVPASAEWIAPFPSPAPAQPHQDSPQPPQSYAAPPPPPPIQGAPMPLPHFQQFHPYGPPPHHPHMM